MKHERNKTIMNEASLLDTSLDIIFAIAMTKIKGDTKRKEQLVKNWVVIYFYKHCKINLNTDHFTAKLEPDYTDPDTYTVANSIIVYGVDFLNKKQIVQMFSPPNQHNIAQVKWINDSNVQLIFLSHETALDALERLTTSIETI